MDDHLVDRYLATQEGGSNPQLIREIVARLRAPDGCPWDRKQTNATLRDALINEVFEAVDAIDSGDMAHLAEELGDLYMLILMHAQIAHESGDFAIEDVYQGIATKIVRRHPHVFGEDTAQAAEDVVGIWNAVKAEEAASGDKRGGKEIDGHPYSMPALTRITRYAAKQPISVDGEVPPLLREVLAIIDTGDDPDTVLRMQFLDHVVARNIKVPDQQGG